VIACYPRLQVLIGGQAMSDGAQRIECLTPTLIPPPIELRQHNIGLTPRLHDYPVDESR